MAVLAFCACLGLLRFNLFLSETRSLPEYVANRRVGEEEEQRMNSALILLERSEPVHCFFPFFFEARLIHVD